MSIVELSITDTRIRRVTRSPRNCQSGRTFDLLMARPPVQVIPRDIDEPESGYLAHHTMLFTAITSLPDRSIRVLHPLRAVVQPKSGVYMASLVDTTISASGESLVEAVDGLKDIVAAKFRLFSRKESILGEQPRRQLRVLRQFLRAT